MTELIIIPILLIGAIGYKMYTDSVNRKKIEDYFLNKGLFLENIEREKHGIWAFIRKNNICYLVEWKNENGKTSTGICEVGPSFPVLLKYLD